ncbi:MAG: ABC transporter permease [Rhodothermales bacterium]
MNSSTILSLFAGMGALKSNPLRTVLSTLGVIIGVAALVAILSIGDSLEQFSRDQIMETTDLQTINLTSRTEEVVDGVRVKLTEPVRFSSEDFRSLAELVEPKATVVPATMASVRVTQPGDSATAVAILSRTTPDAIALMRNAKVLHGTFLTDSTAGNEVVVTANIGRKFSNTDGSANITGETLTIDSLSYKVIGVVDAGAGPPRVVAQILEGGVFVPSDKYPLFTIHAERVEDVTPVVDQMKEWITNRFGDTDTEKRFVIAVSSQRLEQVSRGMRVFKLALGAIAAISLLVGGIGIMNVLLASVAERTREIGVRKAAGARRADILFQFLAESVSITGFGAVLGVVIGVAASAGIMFAIRTLTEATVGFAYTWTSILLAAILAIIIGLVFGMFPAVRASRLSPVDAMRNE